MSYDSEETRHRLLRAAYEEFAAVGLTGARVDRIATAARANKQAIYAYFGSKDRLFDAVLDARVRSLTDLAPLRADSLADYAVSVFDQLQADSALCRLTQWKNLQRPESSPADRQAHDEKVQRIATALSLDTEAASDLLTMVLALAQSWAKTAAQFESPEGMTQRLGRFRERLHRAATAAVDAASVG